LTITVNPDFDDLFLSDILIFIVKRVLTSRVLLALDLPRGSVVAHDRLKVKLELIRFDVLVLYLGFFQWFWGLWQRLAAGFAFLAKNSLCVLNSFL
jgi:hypothetical protein